MAVAVARAGVEALPVGAFGGDLPAEVEALDWAAPPELTHPRGPNRTALAHAARRGYPPLLAVRRVKLSGPATGSPAGRVASLWRDRLSVITEKAQSAVQEIAASDQVKGARTQLGDFFRRSSSTASGGSPRTPGDEGASAAPGGERSAEV